MLEYATPRGVPLKEQMYLLNWGTMCSRGTQLDDNFAVFYEFTLNSRLYIIAMHCQFKCMLCAFIMLVFLLQIYVMSSVLTTSPRKGGFFLGLFFLDYFTLGYHFRFRVS